MISDLGAGDAYRTRNLQLGYTVGAFDQALCAGTGGTRFGFFWNGTNGQTKALCPLAGDAASEGYDLELLGYASVAGASIAADGTQRPVLWNQQSDGSFLPSALRLPTGSASGIAWGTEPYGQIAGEVQVGGERRAAYWPIPSWTPTVFPLAGQSAAFGVGGSSTDPFAGGQHQGKFALWRPKRTTDAVSYPLGDEPSVALGFQVNSSNVAMAAGQHGTAGAGGAFFWRSDTGVTYLAGLGGGDGEAFDFNAATNQIVGSSTDFLGKWRAVLWQGWIPWDLNDLKLPTCRDGDPSLCAPWDLELARSINQSGVIVGSGLVDGQHHAFLAQPIELLTWVVKTCTADAQPLCVAQPQVTNSELIIDPLQVKSNASATSSVGEPYAAAAQGYYANDGIAVPNAAAAWTSYAVFDPGSVIAHLPPGQTTLEVRFHFHVEGGASGSAHINSLATINAGVALRPSRNAGEYSSASGSIQVLNGAASTYGIFAGQGAGGAGVELPLILRPFQGPMEVRIEGSASVSLLASGPLTFAEGSVSTLFCAEEPRSITLPDGTPLADLGIKYTLWPTVRDPAGDDPEHRNPCLNPLKQQPDVTPVCDGTGSPVPGESLLVTAPDVIQPGELVEVDALVSPPGGSLTATVMSGNATVERIGTCAALPDGRARCPVSVRGAGTLGPDDTVVVRLAYSKSGCRVDGTARMIASRLQFLDPASGDAPRLLDPSTPLTAQPVEFLRPDPQLLAKYGRRVHGVAADGVTPVLLRFRAPGPGTATFTVADDRGSRDPLRAGRLADPLAPRPVAYADPVTVTVQQVGSDSWAFAVLTAPLDFVRSGIASDSSRGQADPRKLPVKVVFTPQGGGSTFTVTRDLDLVRPPVVLIHGVWSDASSWHWGLQNDGRFFDYPHNYRADAGKPFLVNAKQAYYGVRNALSAFRWTGIAATQADVFGHSMGAILTRIYAGGHDYPLNLGRPSAQARALTREFREPANFGAGAIHKFVLVDSPQFGSPWADFVLAHDRTAYPLLKHFEPRAGDGALDDLRRQGTAVQALPAVTLPVHAMLGQGGAEALDAYANGATNIFASEPALFATLKLLSFLGSDLVAQVFSPEPDHDTVVGICSQRAGLSPGPAAEVVTTDVFQSMHTNNTSSTAYNARAIGLLDAPVASTAFALGLAAPPPQGSLCSVSGLSAGVWSRAMDEDLANASLADEAPPIVDGGLVISAPAPGAVVTAGSSIPVHVEGAGGFVPERIAVLMGSASAEVVGADFDDALTVPDGVVGDVEITAAGVDAAGQIATASPVVVHVEAPAALTGLAVPAEPLALTATSPTATLQVSGHFADGVDRDVASATAGTTYVSTEPTVVTVDGNGTVTAVASGRAQIEVHNGDAVAAADVVIESTPDDSDGDGTVGLSDFLELRACWTGPGDDPAFQPSSNACADTFDADADGDIDRPDYDVFLNRYTGPRLDCNNNGELDLTDIVDGVSQDVDGNGVPDECSGS